MFGQAGAKKEEFLNQAKVAREQRAQVKSKEQGIVKIQVWAVGYKMFYYFLFQSDVNMIIYSCICMLG